MTRRILFLSICPILLYASLAFAQGGSQPEEISITTYYPSPFGSYNELQTNKMAVGDVNGDGQLTYADEPANNGDLAVAGNVGIGTANPQGKLDLRGPLAVNGSVGTLGQVLESQGTLGPPIWSSSSAFQCTTATYDRGYQGNPTCIGTAQCPAGYFVTGGGFYSTVGAMGWQIVNSMPQGSNAWTVSIWGLAQPSNCTVYAVCCK